MHIVYCFLNQSVCVLLTKLAVFCRSIRIQLYVDAALVRELPDGELSHITAFFHTPSVLVNTAQPFDFRQAITLLNNALEHFNTRGSGFVLEYVKRFVVSVLCYRPLHGSTYIPTPRFLALKRCIVNVENRDLKCFLWSVLSALYPPKVHKECVTNYLKYETTLDMTGLNYPVETKQIPQFEKQNPSISINVLSFESDTKSFSIEYLSPERGRQHHISLLLLEDPQDTSKHHYVHVTDLSRLVAHRSKHNGSTHVCSSCLHPFSTSTTLENHIPYCLEHAPQQVRYPDPEDCKLKFVNVKKQQPVSFFLVADFESFLTPTDDDDDDDRSRTKIINEHNVSGFCCHRVTQLDQYRTPPTVYSGDDVISKFYEHVTNESKEIGKIMATNVPMEPLTVQQHSRYTRATVCDNCKQPFTHRNWKVHHHDHLTGKFLFPCCNDCNLQFKSTRTHHGSYQFFLPVIFHNLKNYDSHFIIKNFEKKYVETHGKDHKINYEDIKVIPLNSEKFITFQIGNLRFLDSYQFLSTSLEELVSLLLKSGKENFVETTKYLGNHDLVFAKGVYPYAYITDRSKFDETRLPSIDCFYNDLKDEPLSEEDYDRAQQIWTHFDIQNLRQFHDHYLLSDVLLLIDVFQHFRHTTFDAHRLDCLHFFTLPSLAWNAALKHTEAEIDLITDPDMYLMIENSMRGGIAVISKRHARANNPYVEGYDESQPDSYITYLDANNLYGYAQSEPLPVGNFQFLSKEEISKFDMKFLNSIPSDSSTGYILECDLSYPPELHDLHADYPMAPEHLTITRDLLSPYAKSLIDPLHPWQPFKKLVPNLMNKQKYVCHYRNLQFYLNHGLKLDKIYRIISFTQRPWLKPWIDLCTEQRKTARSDFESDLAKLQANATFGKTMENVRQRVNLRLIADSDKLLKATGKVSFRHSQIINSDLVLVRAARQKVTLNKPISVGFSILELSKLLMYTFYYDHLKAKYGNRCTLLFTDTDSLCCHIETPNLYEDMEVELNEYDTSNFEKDHPLYSTKNHRVLGKFKSETGSLAPKEFVGLRAKMYSLDCGKKSQKKAKGVKKHYVKKNVHHQDFLAVLKREKINTVAKFNTFKSTNHVLNTVQMTKLCLNAFDDKRFILEDGTNTLPYGHYSII